MEIGRALFAAIVRVRERIGQNARLSEKAIIHPWATVTN